MGVWIETVLTVRDENVATVTPYVGVWIETYLLATPFDISTVTPYVGVWIETGNTPRYYWDC